MKMRCLARLTLALLAWAGVLAASGGERWTDEQAGAWSRRTAGWSAAISRPAPPSTSSKCGRPTRSIRPQLTASWAGPRALGFNTVRVFLHNLLWQQDSKGFLKRMDQFLTIAHKHHIGVMFVLFDSCWDPYPKLGQQREPKPFVHNSGWVQ